jgi:hypothetical protein
MNFKIVISFFLTIAITIFSGMVSALSISIYDQPNAEAKVIGTADLSSGIIPIFTPDKGSEWMKIADPRNGNVGWIKSSDIKGAKGSENSVTFTQRIISNDAHPQSFQIIQFGNKPTQLTDEQVEAFVKKMRIQQQEIQQSFQGIMKNMNETIQRQWDMWNTQGGFPMLIMPAPTAKDSKAVPAKPANANNKQAVTGSTPDKKAVKN